MRLLERLSAEIAASGPLTVAQYMHRCLHDPQDGYYATRPALGEGGDFLTAPLVSQMFGEMAGLWAVDVWTQMGSPDRALLVEAGPGDGTLMSDVLRAAKIAPEFVEAADVWLIETSPPLRAMQRARLGEVRWAASLDEVPLGVPIILIANEFLDCLPVRQFVRTDRGWAERLVGVSDDGLAFGYAPSPPPIPDLPGGPTGEVLEVASAQEAFAEALAARIARDGGAGLLIDYGRDQPGFGDTFQALKAHEKVDPLACPGEADLTFHVDFPALLAAARMVGPQTALATQGEFLRRMGIEQRAATLAKARPDQADKLTRQLDRLIGPDQMGELFKAATIHSPGLAPPGFEEAP